MRPSGRCAERRVTRHAGGARPNRTFCAVGGVIMRTLLKVSFTVEASNNAIKDGSLPKILDSLLERLAPEAAYFWTQDGQRGGVIVFDLKPQSDIPSIAEPLFMGMN